MNPFDHSSASYSVGGSITRLEPSGSTGDDQSKTEEEAYVIRTAVIRQAVMDITALSEADAQLAIRIKSSSGADPSFDKWANFAAAAKWIFTDPPLPGDGPEVYPSEGAYHFTYASICESLGVPLETTRERVFSYLGKLAGGLLCSISGPGYARFVNPGKAKQIPQKAPARQRAPAAMPQPQRDGKRAA